MSAYQFWHCNIGNAIKFDIHVQTWLFQSRGFFRGLSFPVASYGLVNSVFFGVYGNVLTHMKGDEDRKSNYREIYTAGYESDGFVWYRT